jgi:hypothetical protein
MKYLRTNLPSRPLRGPPQLTHVTLEPMATDKRLAFKVEMVPERGAIVAKRKQDQKYKGEENRREESQLLAVRYAR